MVYTECTSSCPLTCSNKNQDTSVLCSGDCSPGCECPMGQFIDFGKNGTCVPEKECSCFYKDNYYQNHQSIDLDCNTW